MRVIDTCSARTAHSANIVFARWAQPERWPEWDPEVLNVTFAGPAGAGAKGRMRPAQGPAAAFTVTAFEPDRVFTNASRLPGAQLVFEHRVTPTAEGAAIDVTVGVAGVLASLWHRVLRKNLANAAGSSVGGLLSHLETA